MTYILFRLYSFFGLKLRFNGIAPTIICVCPDRSKYLRLILSISHRELKYTWIFFGGLARLTDYRNFKVRILN